MDSLEVKLAEVDARARSNTKRLDAVEERQTSLETLTQAVAVMKTEAEHTANDVKEIKSDVKELKEKPVKWWETLIVALIGAAAGFVIKALLGA